ncbi:hypothetical protein [Dyella lutea]|uniref:Uncharacterized protein n=1 Tax=Dyella lutea TaxID=2950441 RepID=A0ABT1FCG1_9GAMM|nr:hypothetical protein [Dyella lutea]MCP1375056.1 hypothetical protein [Dyella lutea]
MTTHTTPFVHPSEPSHRWFGGFRRLFGRPEVPVSKPSDAPMSRRHMLLALQESKKRAERIRLMETLQQSKRDAPRGWRLFRHVAGK